MGLEEQEICWGKVCEKQRRRSKSNLGNLHVGMRSDIQKEREKQGKIEGRPLNGRTGLMKSRWLKGSPGVKTAWMAGSNKNAGALKQWRPCGSAYSPEVRV